MQPTSLCSPSTISQSSTPTPRSLSRSQNLTPLSLLATPSPSLAPAAISSFASDFEEARDDPIDALQGSLQPFFMSRSHEIEPPPQGLDGTLLDPTEIGQPSITSTWERYDNRNDGSSWSGFGRTTEQRIEGFGSDRERDPRDPTHLAATGADLAQLVAYLDNRVCALSEVVETQQTRLGRLEQAGVERDRQIEYLLQRTASQAQRPYDHSHYFTPRGYPFISDMTPPRSAHDFSPTSSLPFFDASPTFHRRTVSTPVRPNLTHETLAYTSPEYLHLSQSESVPRSMPSPVQSMQARQSTPTSPGAESYPLDPQSFPRRHHLGSRRPAAHSRTSSSSGDWSSPSRSSAESRLDEEFSIRPLREEGYNYRNLLDTDSEIDEEVFVRRIFLQNDQQCSLFLQQRVKTTSPDKRQRLFETVGRYLFELSTSKFGNFLASRCLEDAEPATVWSYSDRFGGHFLDLSLDPFGCHVVQKLLDRCDQTTKDRVIQELSPFPNTLLQKPSLHVWNRLLSQPNPPSFYRQLAEIGGGSWAKIVKEDGGSLVVQHMLEDWSEVHGCVVARELLDGLEEVARTACGSLFVDRNFLPFRTRVMELASHLAVDTFGAKIVERVIKSTSLPSATLTSFIDEITLAQSDQADPPVVSIASHASGSNLLALLISSSIAPYLDKAKLVRCISANKSVVAERGGAHGAKLLSLVGKT